MDTNPDRESVSKRVSRLLLTAFCVSDDDNDEEEVSLDRDAKIASLQEKIEVERMHKIQVQEELKKIEEQCTQWKEVEECYENIFKKMESIDSISVAELKNMNNELEAENCKVIALKKKWFNDSYAMAELRIKLRMSEYKRDEVEEMIKILEDDQKSSMDATSKYVIQ